MGWSIAPIKDVAFVEACLHMALWRRDQHGRPVPEGIQNLGSALRNKIVVVNQAAKNVMALDSTAGQGADLRGQSAWRIQLPATVWPSPVVMINVHMEHPFEMAPATDQDPVRAFDADGANPSFGETVRPRRLDGSEQHPGAFGAKHVVECPREFGIPIAD